MEMDSQKVHAERTITCPSCAALNSASEAFCEECGAPIGARVTLDPVQTIRAEGFMLRKSLEGRPRFIVLVGTWVLNLPVLLISLGAALYIITKWRGLSAFVFFWMLIGLSYIAFVILYRITRNYIRIPRKE